MVMVSSKSKYKFKLSHLKKQANGLFQGVYPLPSNTFVFQGYAKIFKNTLWRSYSSAFNVAYTPFMYNF